MYASAPCAPRTFPITLCPNWQFGLRLQGIWQLTNAVWLMYLTVAFTLAFANGIKLWL